MRYLVDGVWHNGWPPQRDEADVAARGDPHLCGVDPTTPAGQVRGQCEAACGTERYRVTMVCQQRQGGYRAVLQFVGRPPSLSSLREIGLRDELRGQLARVLDGAAGIVLLFALPADGLRTVTNVVLQQIDRKANKVISIEDERNRYPVIDAVEVRTFDSACGQTALGTFAEVFGTEPRAVVLRDFVRCATVESLCKWLQRRNTCLALSTVPAKGAADALFRVLLMGGDRLRFAHQVTAVLHQRLIRKLCDRCKKPFTAPPILVERLNLPARKRTTFYRPGEVECSHCGGLGYRGRTGIFELLVADNTVRRTVAYQPSLESIREAAATADMWSLEEEGRCWSRRASLRRRN